MNPVQKLDVYDKSISLEERTEWATQKLQRYLWRFQKGHATQTTTRKCAKWAARVAHVVFEAHPELREEGSLMRSFVARAARKQGLRGAAVTTFVDEQYAAGTWWKLVPEEVLKGETK